MGKRDEQRDCITANSDQRARSGAVCRKKITDTVIPFQERVLNDKEEGVEKSHALDNFRIAAGTDGR